MAEPTTHRGYLATTLSALAGWHAAGVVPAGSQPVRPEGPDEESEYAALMAAAASSAALQPGGGRRVVVVVDTPSLDGPIDFADVVAVHCDTDDRPPDADPDDDLAWYATQEIPDLL